MRISSDPFQMYFQILLLLITLRMATFEELPDQKLLEISLCASVKICFNSITLYID